MRVLTAKEVNFVSGGSIDGDQFSDPWVLSGDDSSGSCSSSSSDASCSSSSVSHCQTPAVDGGNGGYLGTGMPCTSGNSIGDVNYTPPTQEESCENAVEAGVVGAALATSSVPMVNTAGTAVAVVGAVSFVASDCAGLGGG